MTTTKEDIDDPLSQAMDMLDTLGGADLGDFAIDDDDDDDEISSGIADTNNGIAKGTNNNIEGEERGISDFSFGDIDLNLEDVAIVSDPLDTDLHNGKPVTLNNNNNKPSVNNNVPNSSSNEEGINKTSQDEIDALRNNLQGTTLSVGAASSTKLQAPKSTDDIASAGDWHPLQDVGSTTTSTPSQPTHTSSAESPNRKGPDNNNNGSSWSTTLSTFATKAAQTVQTAVENVEDALDAGPRGPYAEQRGVSRQGGGVVAGGAGGIRIAQNSAQMMKQQQQKNNRVQGQGGVATQQQQQQQQPRSGGMSYQERQKLLHEQYHAANNNNNTRASPSSTAMLQTSLSNSQLPGSNRTTPIPSPTPSATSSPLKPTTPLTTAQSTAPPVTTQSTFIEKLTSNLDSPTKKALISSALGSELIPGEKVIMFVNNLTDVKDSTFTHVFVGSDDVLRKRGMMDSLLVGEEGSKGEEGSESSGESKECVTVWCCVMTFYRIVVFSCRATLDGKVLLDNDEEDLLDMNGEGGTSSTSSQNNIKNKKDNEIIQQWLYSQNVSIQFQAAHAPLTNTDKQSTQSSKQKHYVFQMPLASIERVEKTMASSQRSLSSSSSTSTSNGYSTGGYILPSSSTVSSTTVSSAMVSLGSQMKPLLGGMTSTATNSNLLTNGNNNTNSSTANGVSSPSGSSTGPMGIILHAKDGGRWIQFSTSSYADAKRAHEALNTYAFPGRRNLGYLFAFESRKAEVMASSNGQGGGTQANEGNVQGGNPIATAASPTRRRFVPTEEYERQGIFQSRNGGNVGSDVGTTTMTYPSPWAPILNANANYGLCATYPSVLVGPRSIVGSSSESGDGDNNIGLLRRCAAFRSENRFPALTWGSPHHGGSIWRSSQPKVGLQGNRSMEDERYLYAIGEEAKRANLAADARNEGGVGGGTSQGRPPIEFLRMLCGRNNEGDLIIEGNSSSGCMMKIMDMRPKSAAMGNRTQGYGYENTNNYRGSTINFYGIGNIHAVRDAYQKVNALCLNPNTSDLQWMQIVENTNWPSMIRLILSAAWQTAFHVHYNRFPVLVHCSHGWDRTSQVPALAQLLLDPYFRTREGFSALVEKDFLSFGHPFHTRCGHGEGKNEQGGDEGQLAPIFLQFLDCTFQLVNQFPDYFEFNARYLLLLSEHIYSCRFGTLLCDSEREREVVAGTRQRTYCMWEYLDSIPELVNRMFDKAASDKAGVLMMPLPMLLRNVTLWTDRYCMYGAKSTLPCVPPSLSDAYPPSYVATCPTEQPIVLHTTRNSTEVLKRALDDAEMWKTTALAALKEVNELKKGQSSIDDEEEDDAV